MLNIDDILLELSYKSSTGIVDLTNPKQIRELGRILRNNRVRNADEIAMRASINFGLLKEAKKTFKGPADPSKVGSMDAEDFEVYAAKLFTLATQNKGKKLTDEQKAEQIGGVFIGDGEQMYDNVCKLDGIRSMVKLEGKTTVSKNWRDWGAPKNVDTPKTDMIGGGGASRISIKKGDAQLMSPEKKELIATFCAAAEHIQPGGLDEIKGQLKKDIQTLINLSKKLLSGAKSDQGLASGHLQTMRKIQQNDKLSDKEKLEKIEQLIDKINTKFKNINKEEGWSKSKGYQPIKSFSKHNMEMVDVLIDAEDNADVLVDKLNKICKGTEFGTAFLYEAASGHLKFDYGNNGHADQMFAASMNGIDVKLLDMSSIGSEAISKLKNIIHFDVSLKSGGYGPTGGPHLGYGFYQSLRIHVAEMINGSQQLNEALVHGHHLVKNQRQLLTEFGWSDIKAGVQKAGQSIKGGWEWFKKQLDSVIDAIQKGWDLLMEKIKQFVAWISKIGASAFNLLKEGTYHVFGILDTEPQISGDGKMNAEALVA